MKQHNRHQLNKASISLLNSVPRSHRFFYFPNGYERIGSRMVGSRLLPSIGVGNSEKEAALTVCL
jgi:hypothetical protein